MSAKSILEADGKAILNYHLTRAPVIKPTPLPASSTHNPPPKLASLYFPADADVKGVLDQAEVTYPWLLVPGSKFVAKPDQLIKRRGKSGLLALNKPWAEAREWIEARAGKPVMVETVEGVLRQFLVEPFVPHPQNTEYYININSVREVRRVFGCSAAEYFDCFWQRLFPSLGSSLSLQSAFFRQSAVRWEILQWEVEAGSCSKHTGALPGFVERPAGRRETGCDPLLGSIRSFAIRTSIFT